MRKLIQSLLFFACDRALHTIIFLPFLTLSADLFIYAELVQSFGGFRYEFIFFFFYFDLLPSGCFKKAGPKINLVTFILCRGQIGML